MNRYKFINENKAHLHTLDGKPLIGTSTTVQVLSKPLTWWAAELAAIECLEAGECIPTIRQEYLEAAAKFGPEKKKAIDALQKKYPLFKKARFAHYDRKNTAADTGIDMHAELEKYVVGCIEQYDGSPQGKGGNLLKDAVPAVQLFAEWGVQNVKRFLASEGHCYSEALWVGGITDLFFEDKEGRLAVMDFKSSKDAYLSQFIQCAGYDIEIAENGILDAEGNLILKPDRPADYYAVFPFGAENPEPKFRFDTGTLRKAFESTVILHKIINVEENQQKAA
jgi:hypothetical protein